MKIRILWCLLLTGMLVATAQVSPSVFADGLQFPVRASFTSQGNLLVSEGGTTEPNTGRLSLISRSGSRRSLLEGLPSGLAHFANPYGPTSTIAKGDTLYMLFGEGVYSGAPPNVILNPAGPASPILSSVIRVKFSADIDRLQSGFQVSSTDHWTLLDGYDLSLSNDMNETATVQLLTAYRPLVRNVLGGTSPTRQSDPYSLVHDAAANVLYVGDAGFETVSKVDLATGKSQVIYRFEPFRRQVPAPAMVDNVPTGICQLDNQIYAGSLTGAPFPENEATIRVIDTNNWTAEPVVRNLTAVVDLVCGKNTDGGSQFVTLERFSAMGAGLGRVRIHENGESRILADGLANVSGLSRDPMSGDFFVVDILGGRILRIPSAQ